MTQESRMKEPCPLQTGQIVRSKAGHDKGRVLLVLRIVDAKHVMVVDGRTRTLEKPKKKRTIHLQPFCRVLEDFSAQQQRPDFTNAWIRKALEPFKFGEESECHPKMS